VIEAMRRIAIASLCVELASLGAPACGNVAESPGATRTVTTGGPTGGDATGAGGDATSSTGGGSGGTGGGGASGASVGPSGPGGEGGGGAGAGGGSAGSSNAGGGPAGGSGGSVATDAGVVAPDGGPGVDLQDIVCRLAGGKPIQGTTTLQHRSSDADREVVRAYLMAMLTGFGLMPQRQDYGTGSNVYAELASTDGAAAPWVVFGAHYDSVLASPGADDNASGVAMVLAIAEHVARLDKRSKNVVFVLFDQEENGLVGSGKYADSLVQRGVTVHSVHAFDQIGWDSDKDRTIEIERPPDDLFAFYTKAHDDGAFTMPIVKAQATGSDHDSFRNRGMPSLNVSEEYQNGDTTPYHHKLGDTCDTLDYEYMSSTLAFMKYMATALLK
jgi:Peptidase family M28